MFGFVIRAGSRLEDQRKALGFPESWLLSNREPTSKASPYKYLISK